MAKRFYTVLILADATSPARKLYIDKTFLAAVSSLTALSIVAFAFFLYQYVNLNVRMLEIKQLRQEASDRNFLAAKVGQLEGEFTRLRDLDRKVRVLAGLDAGENQGTKLGQGGSGTLSQASLLDAVRKGAAHLRNWGGSDLETLGQEITSREQSFRELKGLLEAKRLGLASTPSIWPVRGRITAGYGYRQSPFTHHREMHEGLDIAAALGSPIVATASGIISFVRPLGSFGNVVFINHGHGLTTFYAHVSSFRVKEGQAIKRGQVIAYVGSTGRSTGPHVHYEVLINGAAMDPLKYIIDPLGVKYANEGEPGRHS